MAYTVGGDSFTHKVISTLDKTYATSNVINHMAELDLSKLSDAGFWDHIESDGRSLIATLADGSTRIPMYLGDEFNSTTKKGTAYILVSTYSSSVDTVINLFLGNASLSQPAEDAPYGREATCPSKHKAVLRFSQDPGGSPAQFRDDTANDNDATTTTTMVSGDLVEAPNHGKMVVFDGVTESVSLSTTGFDNTKGTMSFLIEIGFSSPWSAFEIALWFGATGGVNDVAGITYDPNIDDIIYYGGGNSFPRTSGLSFTSGDLHMLTITWDSVAGEKRIYINDGTLNVLNSSYTAKTMPGTGYLFDFNGDGTYSFPGSGISFVASNEVETAAWINARWQNYDNHDNFWKSFTYESSVFRNVSAELIE